MFETSPSLPLKVMPRELKRGNIKNKTKKIIDIKPQSFSPRPKIDKII